MPTMMPQLQLAWPSATMVEGVDSPLNVQEPNARGFLPPGGLLIDRLEADLNDDGRSEFVLVFNSEGDPYEPGNAGIAIAGRDGEEYRKTWEARLSSEGQVADVVIRDINMDGILEVLVLKSTRDEAKHFLHIFAWNGTGYAPLGADGEEAFVSVYYPPEVRNVDSTALEEVVVFEDDGSSERLKAIVYRWDGEVYAREDAIIVLGPARP